LLVADEEVCFVAHDRTAQGADELELLLIRLLVALELREVVNLAER
jgi:hypothetical protein